MQFVSQPARLLLPLHKKKRGGAGGFNAFLTKVLLAGSSDF